MPLFHKNYLISQYFSFVLSESGNWSWIIRHCQNLPKVQVRFGSLRLYFPLILYILIQANTKMQAWNRFKWDTYHDVTFRNCHCLFFMKTFNFTNVSEGFNGAASNSTSSLQLLLAFAVYKTILFPVTAIGNGLLVVTVLIDPLRSFRST